MSSITPKGWCPGALLPMETGDGYLLRLRAPNGALPFSRVREIAALSERFGNGLIDLSARANLQLRGVRAEQLGPLRQRLAELGLLDRDAAAEAVRNVTPSPLAGFDPSAVLDARSYVAALEARLTSEQALHALPAKFGFVIDGGGLLPLADLDADVSFRAFVTPEGPRFSVCLGGALAGTIAPEQLTSAGSAVARAFIALRGSDRRMTALVKRIGVEPIARTAGLALDFEVPRAPRPVRRSDVVGVHRCGAGYFVGAALLFGQMRGRQLEQLARRAQACDAAELRLTAWRALVVPGLESSAANALRDELEVEGFLVDGDDPRLRLAACSGKPACASAFADVRAAALSLAPRLGRFGGTVHVSGCAKGCAFNAPARFTFVATSNGYDLIENGFARDEPRYRAIPLEALADHLTFQPEGAPL